MATHYVRSQSDKETIYQVNISPEKSICDCIDWITRRSQKGEDCKHIKFIKDKYYKTPQ